MDNRDIAAPGEILAYLSTVLREETKESMKAAELLGKRYRLFTENQNQDGGVQILFTGEDQLE